MLLIPCPYCGPRPELEFKHGGEAHVVRDPSVALDADWGAFLYTRSNTKGVIAERWRHSSGCGRFFNCLRDTMSDMILTTYKVGEPRPDLSAKDEASLPGEQYPAAESTQ
ncbi:sarcosine oxidase subunit delta [Lichenihabitans psoromatis]|uniref:sarcosine oxidase subunit delta n=1 Tax=Lichenihabitans psoromatis TaxID=2528642 RepID=UPI00103849B4|nr:sarcosine oxidase subunit delta [Lichenihabitans psoromatis]